MDDKTQFDYKKAYEEAQAKLQTLEICKEQEKEFREREQNRENDRLTVMVVLALVAVSCFIVGFGYPVDDMSILSILINVAINAFGAFLVGGLIYVIGLGIDELIEAKVIKAVVILIVGFISLCLGAWLVR